MPLEQRRQARRPSQLQCRRSSKIKKQTHLHRCQKISDNRCLEEIIRVTAARVLGSLFATVQVQFSLRNMCTAQVGSWHVIFSLWWMYCDATNGCQNAKVERD
ncbi:hypothetical protein BRADI_1g61413v3 [Brachypodium distachyon]|uniref:Uncharacterized protein n=1 Tax=Brachypodium distachyon TaxID=15368 RepID=A0A0Q3JVU9_BRADI|nr:hypothetical protein BRADI_1g61413v3 [Brachypodium distachyon]